jgi:hypothetical protein
VRIVEKDKAYKIEVIKSRKRKNKQEFLVHYVGWPKDFDQWVTEAQITNLK